MPKIYSKENISINIPASIHKEISKRSIKEYFEKVLEGIPKNIFQGITDRLIKDYEKVK